MFLISDNVDTKVGMRLAGIPGITVQTREEVLDALENIPEKTSIVLITGKLMLLCADEINSFKLNNPFPLVIGIPDRHLTYDVEKVISEYVRESIGLKLS
ncbi:MAG: V-type ATP synthase subunit F [Oscillospiraceae bacterium]|jgi:V/A-type H+-transporting ATPase subunit F|nr:V-type ATP synthase subunit F [Oscillospiraceae bacterium]